MRARPRDPDARYCLRAYVEELSGRFDGGFDPARSISAADHEMTPPAGLFLVATLRSEPVGCGALKLHPGAPAEIKRMWVAPSVRGLGLGRRLLAGLEARAAAHGVRVVRLETNHALGEAIGLYRAAGTARWRRSTTSPTRTTGSRRHCLLPADRDDFRLAWPSLPVQAGGGCHGQELPIS